MEFTLQAFAIADANNPVDTVVDRYKTFFADLLNPLNKGEMIYHSYDKVSILTVIPTATPAEGEYNSLTGTIDYTVDFYSDRASWEGQELKSAEMGYVIGGLTFPITFPVTFGNFYASAIAVNDGRSDVYPILTFNANNNEVSITNKTTGLTINIQKTIGANQKLVVNTEPFNMSAFLFEHDGLEWIEIENAIYWISNDSTDDFMLVSGDNKLVVNSAGSGLLPACKIEWRTIYEAV